MIVSCNIHKTYDESSLENEKRVSSLILKTSKVVGKKNSQSEMTFLSKISMKPNLFSNREPSAFIIHGRNLNTSDLPEAHPNQLKILMLMESPNYAGAALAQVRLYVRIY